MLNRKTNGFTSIFWLLLILVLGSISYVGWYVWSLHRINVQTSATNKISASPYAGWQTYHSPDGVFSVLLSSGWGVTTEEPVTVENMPTVLHISFYKGYKSVPVTFTQYKTVISAVTEPHTVIEGYDPYRCVPGGTKQFMESHYAKDVTPIDGYNVAYFSIQNFNNISNCQVYSFWVNYTELEISNIDYETTGDAASHIENVSPAMFNQIVRSLVFKH